jgi:hypothetical protein
VEHEARLDEVVAAPLGRQVEPHPGLHDVVTATRGAPAQDRGGVGVPGDVAGLGLEPEPAVLDAVGALGRGCAGPVPGRLRLAGVAREVVGERRQLTSEAKRSRGIRAVGGRAVRPDGRGRHRAARCAPARADGGPAVHPVEGVEQGGALGEARRGCEVGVAAVDRVVDRPPTARGVCEHRVVADTQPAVAVRQQDGRAADPAGQQGLPLAVQERTERGARPAGEHAVRRERPVAAVGRRPEQPVPPPALDDVRAFVAVGDRHLRGRAGGRRALLVERDLGRVDAAVVAAVVQDAARVDGVAEDVGVERPEEVALGRRVPAGVHERLVGDRPGAGRLVADRHADRAVPIRGAGIRPAQRVVGVGDDEGQVVAVRGPGVDHVGGPEAGAVGRPLRGLGEGVPEVGPVHQVARAHGRDRVEPQLAVLVEVAVVEGIGGAVEVPEAVTGTLSLEHGRVGAAVHGPVAGNRGRERVAVGPRRRGRCRVGGGAGGDRQERASQHERGEDGAEKGPWPAEVSHAWQRCNVVTDLTRGRAEKQPGAAGFAASIPPEGVGLSPPVCGKEQVGERIGTRA